MFKRYLSVWMLALLLLGIQVLYAAPDDHDDANAQARSHVQDFKMWKLMSLLDLSQDQSSKFMPQFNDLEKLTKTYIETRQGLMKKVDQFIDAHSNDQGQVDHLLGDLDREEGNFLKQKHDMEANLLKVLNAQQKASYIKFESDFPKMLREMLRDRGNASGDGAMRDDRASDGPRGNRPANRNRWD